MIEIRRASIRDLKTIIDLDMKLADFHHELDPLHKTGIESKSYFRTYYRKLLCSKKSFVLLASSESKIIGFLSGEVTRGGPFNKRKRVAIVEAIHILPSFRSRKIGSKLLKKFLNWAKSRKVDEAHASVHAKNLASIRYWKNKGFEEMTVILRKTI